jgi:hypothetical protein
MFAQGAEAKGRLFWECIITPRVNTYVKNIAQF